MTIDTVTHDESRLWHQRNPLCLLVAIDAHDKILGYLELLPLTQQAGKHIAQGLIGETDIGPEQMLTPDTTRHAQSAYIAAMPLTNRYATKAVVQHVLC